MTNPRHVTLSPDIEWKLGGDWDEDRVGEEHPSTTRPEGNDTWVPLDWAPYIVRTLLSKDARRAELIQEGVIP